MATDAIRHGSRNRNASRAAKERREKIILVVGLLLLAGLLAFEGPKTLSKLHHGTAAAPASTPAVSTPTGAGTVTPAPARPVDLRRLRNFTAKDPFAAQIASGTSAVGAQATAVTPPAVRAKDFVSKDPFVQQVTVGPAAAPGPGSPPAKSGGAAVHGNLIVIVASVPLAQGQKAANAAAAKARAAGVRDLHVVLSSEYPTLRSGFYAVYSGPYPTLDRALKMLEAIRGRGYVSAYTRRLAR